MSEPADRPPPLWRWVRDDLIQKIERGTYPPGSLLPTVKETKASYHVARTTAERALKEVVAAGYAETRTSVGRISRGPKHRAVS